MYKKDFLIIRHDKGEQYVKIRLFGSLPFPEEVLRAGTYRPLPPLDPIKPERKGLLLVGILVRQLGGVVEVANSVGKSRCSIFIRVPLRQEDKL